MHIFFFSKNISIYGIFNDQSFNDMLTNDIVSFEQLGPGVQEKAGVMIENNDYFMIIWTATSIKHLKTCATNEGGSDFRSAKYFLTLWLMLHFLKPIACFL